MAVTVTPVNDDPIGGDDNYNPEAQEDALTTPEDTALTIAPATLLGNDTDVDGNTLSIISVQDPINGTVSLVEGECRLHSRRRL